MTIKAADPGTIEMRRSLGKNKNDANYKIYIVHSHIQGVASIKLVWVLISYSIQNAKCIKIYGPKIPKFSLFGPALVLAMPRP